ncbi:WD40 repeat-like protein [Coemansia reversa NRRL 1564]|uniref:WD40 repeat-containing protein SMU1 n=1 Tax=Coemansia reversa (strain ATCC 12441 / NRRL 1564) TaxID=763665 RepID=A0A2G5BB67_COERN|nr:WD40 repeat-like protein [Coemansia reversa NRRL 1564]|eukprot:PIA16255.1 WD40 repeat-like protein [Coemansia reversa NRRL 1564]
MSIESGDVIRLIEQFLKENNLHSSLEALQNETGISLNTVDDISTFKENILKGKWDAVLSSVEQAHVPQVKRIELYEQIIIELAETQDITPARALLRQTEPMEILRLNEPERYLNLERLLSRSSFDAAQIYRERGSKEARRSSIAEELVNQVDTASTSRLLTLLSQSIKWQQQQGIIAKDVPHNLFLGKTQEIKPAEDKTPCKLLATIKFPKKQSPKSLAFSPKGTHLVTGSADGFIELWNCMTGKIASELKYQAEGALMMMEGAVTALSFSHNGELICSGANDGKLKVWKASSGSGIKRFSAAHSETITCVTFSDDDTQVLSGGFDSVLRIHGLKSGKMLKEFRGHSAPVNSVIFSTDMIRVVSSSDDGTVRIWDVATGNCMHAIVPSIEKLGLSAPAAHSALAIPGSPGEFVVCTKSPNIYVISMDGQIRRSFSADKSTCNVFLAAAVSPKGKYIYAVSDMSVLHCFDLDTGNLSTVKTKIPIPDVLGIACHPTLNIAAFFSNDRRIPIWTA